MLDVVTYALCKKFTQDAIAAFGDVFSVRGTVYSYGDLPIENNKNGDVYLVGPKTDGSFDEYFWSSSLTWELMGSTAINMEGIITKANLYEGENGTGTVENPAEDTIIYTLKSEFYNKEEIDEEFKKVNTNIRSNTENINRHEETLEEMSKDITENQNDISDLKDGLITIDEKYAKSIDTNEVIVADYKQVTLEENGYMENLIIEDEKELTQETREGYNQVDFSSDAKYPLVNDVLTIKSSNSYAHAEFDILDIIKNNIGKTLYFSCKSFDFSNSNKGNVQINYKLNDIQNYPNMLSNSGAFYSFEITEAMADCTSALLCIYCNNAMSDGTEYTTTITEPMLAFENNLPYEAYGISPSIAYPSKFQNLDNQIVIRNSKQNLLNVKSFMASQTQNGIRYDIKDNGNIIINGTSTGYSGVYSKGGFDTDNYTIFKVKKGHTYKFYLNVEGSDGVETRAFFGPKGANACGVALVGNGTKASLFTPTKDNEIHHFSIIGGVNPGDTRENSLVRVWIYDITDGLPEDASYQQYEGYEKKLITSEEKFLVANFNGYKNYIKESTLYKNIKVVTFTGSEGWVLDTDINRFGIYAYDSKLISSTIPQLCTHFRLYERYAEAVGSFGVGNSYIRCHNDNNMTLEEWKNFLKAEYENGNPVQIAYVSQEEQEELSKENKDVIKSLTYYEGVNNIFALNNKILKFNANRALSAYVDEKINDNNLILNEKINNNTTSINQNTQTIEEHTEKIVEIEKSIEEHVIESDKTYVESVETSMITVNEFAEVELDEDAYMENVTITAAEALTQDTRQGYNKFLNPFKNSEVNGITVTVNEDKIHFEGELLSGGASIRATAHIPEDLLGKTVTLTIFGLENTNFVNGGYKDVITGDNILVVTPKENSITTIITQDMIDKANIFDFFATSTSFSTINNDVYIQICEGEKKSYEPYGQMPSLAYPSEIKNKINKININVSNENILYIDNEDYKPGWTTTHNGITYTVQDDLGLHCVGTALKEYNSTLHLIMLEPEVSNKLTVKNLTGRLYTYITGNFTEPQAKIVGHTPENTYMVISNSGTLITKDVYFDRVYAEIKAGSTVDCVIYPQITYSKVDKYIPHKGYSKEITLPENKFLGKYYDKIYSSSYENVIKNNKLNSDLVECVFTGNELFWQIDDSPNFNEFVLRFSSNSLLPPVIDSDQNPISNYFWDKSDNRMVIAGTNRDYLYIRVPISYGLNTVESFRAKLKELYNAGAPVKMIYATAEKNIEDISQQNKDIINTLAVYEGKNNITNTGTILEFKANKNLTNYIQDKIDETIDIELTKHEIEADKTYLKADNAVANVVEISQLNLDHSGYMEDISITTANDIKQNTRQGYNMIDPTNFIHGAYGYGDAGIKPSLSVKNYRATIDIEHAIEVVAAQTYTVIFPEEYQYGVAQLTEDKISLGDTGWIHGKNTVVIKDNAKYVGINIRNSVNTESTVDLAALKAVSGIMLYEGTEDKVYEQYGRMPSFNYPSELQNIYTEAKIRVTNENLLDFKVSQNNKVTVNNNGTITINGTGGFNLFTKAQILKANEAYVYGMKLVSGTVTGVDINFTVRGLGDIHWLTENGKTELRPNGDKLVSAMWLNAGATFNNATFKIWLNKGTELLDFKPCEGYDKTISLPEGEFLASLAKGEYKNKIENDTLIKRLKEYTFTGEEKFVLDDIYNGINQFRCGIDKNIDYNVNDFKVRIFSNYFLGVYYPDSWTRDYTVTTMGNGNVRFMTSQYATVEDFKVKLAELYAAGTPLKIVYAITNEEQVQLSEENINTLNEMPLYKDINNIAANNFVLNFKYNQNLSEYVQNVINENNVYVNTQISNEVNTINTRIDNEIETVNNNLEKHTVEAEKVFLKATEESSITFDTFGQLKTRNTGYAENITIKPKYQLTQETHTTGINVLYSESKYWEQGTLTLAEGLPLENNTRIRNKDFIPVSASTNYYVSLEDTIYTFVNIAFYDSTKIFISNQESIDSINGLSEKAITTPENCAYVKVIIKKNDVDEILPSAVSIIKPMMAEGTEKLSYVASYPVMPSVHYPSDLSIEKDGVYSISNVGKNIIDTTNINQTRSGLTITSTEDGGLHIKGTPTSTWFTLREREFHLSKGTTVATNWGTNPNNLNKDTNCGFFVWFRQDTNISSAINSASQPNTIGSIWSSTMNNICFGIEGLDTTREYDEVIYFEAEVVEDNKLPTSFETFKSNNLNVILGDNNYLIKLGGVENKIENNIFKKNIKYKNLKNILGGWGYSQDENRLFTADPQGDIVAPSNNNKVGKILCTHFKPTFLYDLTQQTNPVNGIAISDTGRISIRNTEFSTYQEYIDFINNNDIYIAYQIKEEIEESVVLGSLEIYEGINNISCRDLIVEFDYNKDIITYIEENNKSERAISDFKYAKALKGNVENTDFAQIHAEHQDIENLKIYGAELTQDTREGYNKLPITYESGSIPTHGITVTYNKETGLFKVVGTATEPTWVNIFPVLKSSTSQSDAGENVDVNGKYLVSNYSKWDSASKIAVMFTDDTDTITQLNNAGVTYIKFNTETVNRGWIYIPSTGTELNEEFWLMITDTYENQTYEQYGAMPSLDFPSEVHTMNDRVNLFDKDNVIEGELSDAGNVLANTHWRVSDYIEVSPLTNYMFSWVSDSAYFQITVAMYKSDKTFLSKNNYSMSNSYAKTFQTISECKYLRIAYSVNVSGTNVTREKIKLAKGTQTSPYSPHGQSSLKVENINENLAKVNYNSTTKAGVTITNNGNGSLSFNGTSTGSFNDYITDKFVLPAGDYILFANKTHPTSNLFGNFSLLDVSNNSIIKTMNFNYSYVNFTLKEEKTCKIQYYVPNGITLSNFIIYPMVLRGKDLKPFVPHQSQATLIPFPQNTFNGAIGSYKDTIKEVDGRFKVEKWIKEIILNGSENWTLSGNTTDTILVPNFALSKTGIDDVFKSTHFKQKKNVVINSGNIYNNGHNIRFYLDKNIYPDINSFKAKLTELYNAGTPVKIYYALATPEYIDLPDEIQEILNGIKLRLGLNNFSIDVGQFDFTYNRDLNYTIEKLEELIGNLETLLANL